MIYERYNFSSVDPTFEFYLIKRGWREETDERRPSCVIYDKSGMPCLFATDLDPIERCAKPYMIFMLFLPVVR